MTIKELREKLAKEELDLLAASNKFLSDSKSENGLQTTKELPFDYWIMMGKIRAIQSFIKDLDDTIP